MGDHIMILWRHFRVSVIDMLYSIECYTMLLAKVEIERVSRGIGLLADLINNVYPPS